MKKIVFIICALFVGMANADNVITSKEYVDGQVATLQTQIPAKNANTVVTNTGTAGTIGEKKIYDASDDYASQQDALVTAGAFNTAVQNALETEFVCIERQAGTGGCLLYQIRAKQTLPAGYTQLEYIRTDSGAFIRLNGYTNNDTSYDTVMTRVCEEPYKGLYGAASDSSWPNGSGVQTGANGAVYLLSGAEDNFTKAMSNNTEVHIVQNKNVYSFSDINGTRTYTRPGGTFQSTAQIEMGSIRAYGSSRPCDSIWRYFNVSNMVDLQGNVLPDVHLIPARRDSDGELGMYDLVSNTFFTNSGTGEFIAGPVASYLPQNQQ